MKLKLVIRNKTDSLSYGVKFADFKLILQGSNEMKLEFHSIE